MTAISGDSQILFISRLNRVNILQLPTVIGPAVSFEVSGYPRLTRRDVVGDFTIRAKDAYGQTVTDYAGTVSFTSSDPSAVLPMDYTFTPDDGGVRQFTARLLTTGAHSLSVREVSTAAVTGAQSGIVIHDGHVSQLPVANRRDLVFDPVREVLYISTSDGRIERFDVATQTLLAAWIVGSSLHGMDVSPDGNAVYVVDAVRSALQAAVHRVDVGTGDASTLWYDVEPRETGGWDLAIGANGRALFSSLHQDSQFVPLRSLELANGTISKRHEVWSGAEIGRSADRSLIVTRGPGGAIASYNPFADTFTSAYPGTYNTFRDFVVSRDGMHLAAEIDASESVAILDRNLRAVENLLRLAGGLAFDPQRDLLYGIDSTSNEVVAIRTTSWQEEFRLPIGQDVGASAPMGSGVMVVNQDSTLLFLSTAAGVQLVDLPTSIGPVSRFAVFGFPAFSSTGTEGTFHVVAQDAIGQTVTNYTGTVTFSSSDPAAVLPPPYTFTHVNSGRHSFTAQFNTPGVHNLWLSDTADTGMQANILVHSAGIAPFVPVENVRDHVFDQRRGILYLATSTGFVERYDVSAQTLLEPWQVGNALNGIDITLDGAFLYAAEQSRNVEGLLRKINLDSGARSTLRYAIEWYELGTWDVKLGSHERGFLTVDVNPFYDGTARELFLSTDIIQKRAEFEVAPPLPVHRSADRAVMVLASSGSVVAYLAATDMVHLTFTGFASPTAVNRDGSMIAFRSGSNILIVDGSLTVVRQFPDLGGGLAFDSVRNRLYAVDAQADQLVVLDTNSWSELDRIAVGVDMPSSPPFGSGEMTVSLDGEWLFLSTPAGIRVFDLPTPPGLSISSPTVVEGNSGTTSVVFSVTLPDPRAFAFTVDYATGDGTATAGTDYQAASSQLTFLPGETSKTVTVTILADAVDEPDETFSLMLASAVGVAIDNQGLGAIANDDAPPAIGGVFSEGVALQENHQFDTSVAELTFAFSEEVVSAGGDPSSVTNPANWSLSRAGVDISWAIRSIGFGFNAAGARWEAVVRFDAQPGLLGDQPLVGGNYTIMARGDSTIRDLAGDALDGNFDGEAGGNYVMRFAISEFGPAGGEFPVNADTLWNQQYPGIAVDGDGDAFVAWVSFGGDGYPESVKARLYNRFGAPFRPEFSVSSGGPIGLSSSFGNLGVAVDADGDAVVVWNSATGLKARLFHGDGTPRGMEFAIGPPSVLALNPQVAMDADGDFVVVFAVYEQGLSTFDIFARRYSADGAPQGDLFLVNTVQEGDQIDPDVAMAADGGFVVTWLNGDWLTPGNTIRAQRYSAAGIPVGGEFDAGAGPSVAPSAYAGATVAMAPTGEFVVAWDWLSLGAPQTQLMSAQRFSSVGQPIGGPVAISEDTVDRDPAIVLFAGGEWIAAWDGSDTSNTAVLAQRFDANNARIGAAWRVNTYTNLMQFNPAVAATRDGDVWVIWQSEGQDGSGHGLYGQRYVEANDHAPPLVADVLHQGERVLPDSPIIGDVSQLLVTFSEELVASSPAAAESVTNPANWSLSRNGNLLSGAVTSISYGFNVAANRFEALLTLDGNESLAGVQVLEPGNYVLTASNGSRLQDPAGNAVDGDYDGLEGGAFRRRFSVFASASPGLYQSRGGELRLGSQFSLSQEQPRAAASADGSSVVIWQTETLGGSGYQLVARRLAPDGSPLGPLVLVATGLSGWTDADVAIDDNQNFVVVWRGLIEGDSLSHIFARRFNADGSPRDSADLLVDTSTVSSASRPSVAVDGTGDFVVTWTALNSSFLYQVFARSFRADGTPIEPFAVRINTTANSNFQHNSPDVALDENGAIAIVWRTLAPGGGDIYVRRFTTLSTALDTEPVLVNQSTAGSQAWPAIASKPQGGFVVVWSSIDDHFMANIVARSVEAAGPLAGAEYRVSQSLASAMDPASLTIDQGGVTFFAWTSAAATPEGGVLARTFTPEGAPLTSEFRLHDPTYLYHSPARGPRVAGDASGQIVVVWEAYQYNTSTDVFARVFTPAPLPLLQVQDLTVTEGDAGVGNHAWKLTLSAPVAAPVTVQYAVNKNDAQPGLDFAPVAGTLTFLPGQTTQWLPLEILGDLVGEGDESLILHLFDATNALLYEQQVQAAVFDNDRAFSISDVTVVEGANGTRYAMLSVSISPLASRVASTVEFATLEGSAHAGSDYLPTSGTLYFPPGFRLASISVQIQGDMLNESSESFFLNLFNPQFGKVQDAQARVNIRDDDPILVTAADAGGGPHVKVYDGTTLAEKFSFFAYAGAYTGGVRVATGDVNGDGVPDIITGTGFGGGPHVRVFDGVTGENLPGPIGNFFAYAPAYTGGLYLAAGDFNHDGKDDIVTGVDFGGGPHIRVFNGADGSVLGQFFAYWFDFTGGVRVAVGDVDGDGTPDIITGAGPGGGPHVQVWHLDGTRVAGPIGTFFVYSPVFTAGIYVAAGDVDGDGRADVITGAGREGGPHVRAFRSPDLAELANFFAYDGAFTGGVRIATSDFNADGRDDIVTAPGPGGGPHVRVFSTQPVAEATSLLAYAAAFTGGLFVAGTPLAASPPMAPAPATAPNQAIENIVAPVDPGSAMVHLADHGNETGDDLDDWIPFSPDAEARSAALALEEDWLSPLEAQQ